MKPLAPTTPHLIILMGIPGAGKTHFAEHFTKMFHAPYVNAHSLQLLAGSDDSHTEDLALHMVSEIAKTQRTFVYEGPTYSRAHRQALAKIVHQAKLKPLLIWVQTDSVEAKKRVQRQRMYTSEEFEVMLAKFQVPLAAEKPIVISGKHTFATQVKMVLKHIATGSIVNRPEPPKPAPRTGRIISIR